MTLKLTRHDSACPAPTNSLNTLPAELVAEVLSYLPTSSLIAVKLASKALFLKTPHPPKDWQDRSTWCEKKAARRYLEERKDLASNRRRCILCQAHQKPYRFPSDTPICRYHEARFMAVSKAQLDDAPCKTPAHPLLAKPHGHAAFWVQVTRDYCVHNRVVVGWDAQACGCLCRSCGHFPVQCYARVADGTAGEPRYAELSPGAEYVVEEHWWRGKSRLAQLLLRRGGGGGGGGPSIHRLTMLQARDKRWEPVVCWYPSSGWRSRPWILE